MGGDWPLVGRADELVRVGGLLRDSDCRGVMLAGPAGVGKTRLALECLAEAERRGLATARVRATPAARRIPFGALAPLLPPADAPAPGAVDDRSEMMRRCAAALAGRADGNRLVVLVDDAHLLDDPSAAVAHQVAEAGRAFVLATLRTDEPTPEAVTALWADGLIERLDLAVLEAGAVDELLTAVLGGEIDRGAVGELTRRSGGNVLFLREMVTGALASGALHRDRGLWRLTGPLAPSDRLVELVESRLFSLTDAQRALLELVALGEPLGAAQLSAAEAALIDDLERDSLLASRLDGQRREIRLAHPLHGEVLRERLSIRRGRSLARRLAESVEATGTRRREDVLRVATWRLDGGGEMDPDLMLSAATTARWRYDFPAAERLADAALQAGAGFDVALLLAQLDYLQGRGGEAEARLAPLIAEADTDARLTLAVITRHDNLMYLCRYHDALRIVEDAEGLVADRAWRDELVAKRLGPAIALQGVGATAALAEPLFGSEGRALVWACLLGALSLARIGRIADALKATERGHRAHMGFTGPPSEWYPASHLFARAQALAYAGRLGEAEALAAGQYREALAEHSEERQAWFAWVLAEISLLAGRPATAARYGREGAALLHQLGRFPFSGISFAHVVMAAAVQGKADETRRALAELDGHGPPVMWLATDHFAARAWAAAACGQLDEAFQGLSDAAGLADATGDRMGAAACLHDLARLGQPEKVASRLVRLAGEVEGDLVAARAAHVRALAALDPAGLDAAATAFETMGANLFAAEAAAAAGRAWQAAGAAEEAVAAQNKARALAGRCEEATTPALRTRTEVHEGRP